MASPLSPFRRLLLSLLLLLAAPLQAQTTTEWVTYNAQGKPDVQLYYFWSLTCPYCIEARPYIQALPEDRPWLKLQTFELSRNRGNARIFQQMVEELHPGEQVGVPAFLFCGELHVGWESDATTGAMLRRQLDRCHARALRQAATATTAESAEAAETAEAALEERAKELITIPLLGTFEPGALSLPLMTVVLGGLDAFNPCAFFVLLFLLSMMAHQKSRNRMLLIGGIFVVTSGVMYFLFMAAWLNLFQIIGHLAAVTLAAGALAVVVGVINIKDFFWFQKGVSLSISDSRKADIFRRSRKILSAENLPAMAAATLLLAIAVNFYELLCTAGFPMVYTRLLTLADLTPGVRYAYLALYNVIYVIPLMVIVILFARTLGARKLTEREGRLLKLMSGLMMLGLGLLLLLAPERITQIGIAFGLMLTAVALTWVAARLTREPLATTPRNAPPLHHRPRGSESRNRKKTKGSKD